MSGAAFAIGLGVGAAVIWWLVIAVAAVWVFCISAKEERDE